MTRDEAISALGELAYDFHNHMAARGIDALPIDEWIEEFRAWLPDGKAFAQLHEVRRQWLEDMERRGRNGSGAAVPLLAEEQPC